MNIEIPTEELALEIFQHLSKLLEQQERQRAPDPLELLDIRDLEIAGALIQPPPACL